MVSWRAATRRGLVGDAEWSTGDAPTPEVADSRSGPDLPSWPLDRPAADAGAWDVGLGEPEPDAESNPNDDVTGPGLAARLSRHVSFRNRLSALVAAAVGVAVALAAVGSYIAVRHQLEAQVTHNLNNDIAALGSAGPDVGRLQQRVEGLEYRTGVRVQFLVDAPSDPGNVQVAQLLVPGIPEQGALPAQPQDKAIALSSNPDATRFSSVSIGGVPYRVETSQIGPGVAAQVFYSVSDTQHALSDLGIILVLVALGGVALATALGWIVGRTSIRPVERLTAAAEHVAATQDLSATIEEGRSDELGRLASSFNAMLRALGNSRMQQAQLVSDAGHELRTPLTSLRTNIEVLMRKKDLAGPDRDELLSDVESQIEELTTLVGDLVDLARQDETEATPELVPFESLVEHSLERVHRRALSLTFDVQLTPGNVLAQPALLERAVLNVLDNAAKWSPSGGTVSVRLWAEEGWWHLTVRDQGPGIAAEDLPRIFDRFFRAPTARSMPGSGLGLAIVHRTVTTAGGTVAASTPPGGGTLMHITLPYPSTS
jgi:two-component system sensor histidine kinase MprB